MIRSDSRDSKNRVRSSDAHSTSGTLGRRNKGGMWEDPQQRMIQEQLDSMRDDEIIELKNKPNKTPKDEERYDLILENIGTILKNSTFRTDNVVGLRSYVT